TADFLPDGRVVFTQGSELYTAENDGSNVRKLPNALPAGADEIYCPIFSPDGRLVFLARFSGDRSLSLMETKPDGSVHTIDTSARCAPHWTPDGKYLLYRKQHPNRQDSDIWITDAQIGFFRRRRQATELTNGPLTYWGAIPSRDGKRIFLIGTKRHGE